MADKQYYIEFYQSGNSVKVTAADPVTMTEATIIGPLNATKEQLQNLAIRKLEYMLRKNHNG